MGQAQGLETPSTAGGVVHRDSQAGRKSMVTQPKNKSPPRHLSWRERKSHHCNQPDLDALVIKKDENRRYNSSPPLKARLWLMLELQPINRELHYKTWGTWHLINTHYHSGLFL